MMLLVSHNLLCANAIHETKLNMHERRHAADNVLSNLRLSESKARLRVEIRI